MPTEEDYKTARALAFEKLAELDVGGCCKRAGLSFETVSPDKKRVSIPYLGKTYHLSVSTEKTSFDEGEEAPKISDQVLLLHYLITATGIPFADEWITFREVPSGSFYYPSFVKRAIDPLVRSFGKRPELLEGTAGRLGQLMVTLPGDKGAKILALPRVPVVLALWRGDDEFPPEGNVYFDASVSSYLSTEDIAYLAGATVYRIISMARDVAGL
ncbi:MAG: DUF3786 domain-containing protein [Thermodesulfobacteriota bacterium]|nr:DUF3786 domain-containing protein [Thermodesulfobacteriota bacterium]